MCNCKYAHKRAANCCTWCSPWTGKSLVLTQTFRLFLWDSQQSLAFLAPPSSVLFISQRGRPAGQFIYLFINKRVVSRFAGDCLYDNHLIKEVKRMAGAMWKRQQTQETWTLHQSRTKVTKRQQAAIQKQQVLYMLLLMKTVSPFRPRILN